MKITSSNITKLKRGEIFVFGSNKLGKHAGGAAKIATDKFGAEDGISEGLTGNCYAFPTLDENFNKVSIESLKESISKLETCIKKHPDKHFHITAVGCGIAGFSEQEIAPLFKFTWNYDNVSVPESFLPHLFFHGYKVTNSNMQCRGFQYEMGKVFETDKVGACSSGFHFCEELNDCFEYYDFDSTNRVFEVGGSGKFDRESDKIAVEKIEFLRELTWFEVLAACNIGKENTGRTNSGNWNSGDRNSGDSNSGYRNSGNWNSGDSNSGYSNSGDSNSGYSNSGYRNSGDRNSGDRNSGDSNSGNWNSGDRNSGDSNSGYRNSGAFCTEADPVLWLFDKPTKITVRQWEQMEPCKIMNSIDLTIWVPASIMTDQEKANNPKWETTEGFLKTIPIHEAWANFWGNLSEEKKQVFLDLPNFDAGKFEIITGIKV